MNKLNVDPNKVIEYLSTLHLMSAYLHEDEMMKLGAKMEELASIHLLILGELGENNSVNNLLDTRMQVLIGIALPLINDHRRTMGKLTLFKRISEFNFKDLASTEEYKQRLATFESIKISLDSVKSTLDVFAMGELEADVHVLEHYISMMMENEVSQDSINLFDEMLESLDSKVVEKLSILDNVDEV